jgi:hypothetical protein
LLSAFAIVGIDRSTFNIGAFTITRPSRHPLFLLLSAWKKRKQNTKLEFVICP